VHTDTALRERNMQPAPSTMGERARSQMPEPVPKFELLMPTRIRVGYKFAGRQEASRITVAAERKIKLISAHSVSQSANIICRYTVSIVLAYRFQASIGGRAEEK
jgi:hypothetical protein